MGSVDRVLRSITAIATGTVIYADVVTGTAAILLGVLAVHFVLTSAVSFCPFYVLLKFSTVKK
jgi:hypothetical protein